MKLLLLPYAAVALACLGFAVTFSQAAPAQVNTPSIAIMYDQEGIPRARLSIPATQGMVYEIEKSSGLGAPGTPWLPVDTVSAVASGILEWTDPAPLQDRMFYRLRCMPSFGPDALAELATSLDATAFFISPQFCYAERTTAAVTPIAVGEPVGCLRSVDGAWFAVPAQDDRRPILRIDDAGNYYLATAGANMRIFHADGSPRTLGTSWTHIGGWRRASTGGGSAFCWGRNTNQANRFEIRSLPNYGARPRIQTALNVWGNFSNQNSVDVPHVFRMVKSPEAANYYYNADTTPAAPALVPWDDSGHIRELGLFMQRTGFASSAAFGGRFYGGWWSSADLDECQAAQVTGFYLARTIPTTSVFEVSLYPTILDFENGIYAWDGEVRDLDDLTDNGGGSYTLQDAGAWAQAHTVVIDVSTDLQAGSWSGTMLEFLSSNVANERVFVDTQAPTSTRLAHSTAASANLFNWRGVLNMEGGGHRRVRATYLVPPTGNVQGASQGSTPAAMSHSSFPSFSPAQIRVNTQVNGWRTHRVAIYPEILAGSKLANAVNAGPVPPVHFLGDSFVLWGTGAELTTNLLYSQARPDNPDLIISRDGAGGIAFYEPGGNGHAQRFAATPLHFGKTVIMLDGGFEVSNRTNDQIHPWIQSIVDNLDHGAEKRYLFVESNPINPVGDSRRDRWEEVTTVVKSDHGTRYVETLEAMFCLYNSTNDIIDVSNGLWPRSTRSDSTHYLVPGRALYAKAILGALKDFGWVRGTTSLPDEVQTLAATSGLITWEPPASDGGHPVMGYLIQRWDGADWVDQSPQGSPSGYTKQYIRSWTAPVVGTYRVAAITRKGIGEFTEVFVE